MDELRSGPVARTADRALLTCRIYAGSLREVRARVGRCVGELVSGADRAYDFTVAVNEIVTNVVVHGGGSGWLRLWRTGRELVCEVSDNGPGMADPRAGTTPPAVSAVGGYGLWLARTLCDGLSVRTAPGVGTSVRLRIELA